MTDQEEIFVLEYMKDFNAAQAAVRAGYSVNRGRQTGYDLLQKPEIQAALKKGLESRKTRIRASADRVIEEIENLALYDPGDVVDVKCPEDIKKLPEHVRRAVAGWGWDKEGRFVLKMNAKPASLDQLGRTLKLFTDKLELSGNVGLAEKLKAARERSLKR